MARPVYSTEQNWNRLGLRGYSRPGRRQPFIRLAELHVPVPAASLEGWTAPLGVDLPDDELLKMAEREGHFSFLDDPSEDMYTWDDGEDI